MEEQLPPLPAGIVDPNLFRAMGTFRTLAEAIAAVKAVQLAPGTYGSVNVGNHFLAIDSTGKAYHVTEAAGSGQGQRPPQ